MLFHHRLHFILFSAVVECRRRARLERACSVYFLLVIVVVAVMVNFIVKISIFVTKTVLRNFFFSQNFLIENIFHHKNDGQRTARHRGARITSTNAHK